MLRLILITLMVTQIPQRREIDYDEFIITSLRSPKICKELNLSEEQIRKISDIHYTYATKVVDLKASLQKRHLELNRVISIGNFTRADIEPILKEIGSIEAELRLNRIMEVQEIKRVLTKEQSQKLREIFKREQQIRRKVNVERD